MRKLNALLADNNSEAIDLFERLHDELSVALSKEGLHEIEKYMGQFEFGAAQKKIASILETADS